MFLDVAQKEVPVEEILSAPRCLCFERLIING